jgi:ketosteroid isomerase-like protein
MEAKELAAELWRRIQARDWPGLTELLDEDFTVDWPDMSWRISGRANYVEFNRNYPEGWSIEVMRVVGEGDTAVTEVRVPHETLGVYYTVGFFESDGERLTRAREYWLPERNEDVPAEREQWFERIR